MFEEVLFLWKKQTKDGREYLTGKIDLGTQCIIHLVASPNLDKIDESDPDYTGLISKLPIKNKIPDPPYKPTTKKRK